MARKQVNINCQHFNKGVGICNALPKRWSFIIIKHAPECVLINQCNSCEHQKKYRRPTQPPAPQKQVTEEK